MTNYWNRALITSILVGIIVPVADADIITTSKGEEIECIIMMKAMDTYLVKYLDKDSCEVVTKKIPSKDVTSIEDESEDEPLSRLWYVKTFYNCPSDERGIQIAFFKRYYSFDDRHRAIKQSMDPRMTEDISIFYLEMKKYAKRFGLLAQEIEQVPLPPVDDPDLKVALEAAFGRYREGIKKLHTTANGIKNAFEGRTDVNPYAILGSFSDANEQIDQAILSMGMVQVLLDIKVADITGERIPEEVPIKTLDQRTP